MPPTLDLVANAHCHIAEGPLWHPEQQCLYWTDIPVGRIYRFDPRRDDVSLVHQGDPVGGMTVEQDGSLLLFGARGSVQRMRDDRVTEVLVTEIPGEYNSRFNDVIADPSGRVIGGTMAIRDEDGAIVQHGRLYCLDTDGDLRVLLGGTGSPNGMGFSQDLVHMYLTESIVGVQSIFRFDYDTTSGTVSNKVLFHQTPLDGHDGRPDGMTLDSEGCIWSARWDGSAVVRLAPDGHEVERHILPVSKVSSLTFGGEDLTDLYITTASIGSTSANEPTAGGVFRLRSGTRGMPEFHSRIGSNQPERSTRS